MARRYRDILPGLAVSAASLLLSGSALADGPCAAGAEPEAVIAVLEGDVVVVRDGVEIALGRDRALCPGDRVSTGETGRVEIAFPAEDTVVGITRNSTIRIPASDGADVALETGFLRFLSSVRTYFEVETRLGNAGIDGTEAVVATTGPDDATLVLVQEGVVRFAAPRSGRELMLSKGEAAFASRTVALTEADQAQLPPVYRAMVADPTGATDWAVYYPPVLLADQSGGPAAEAARLLETDRPEAADALVAGASDAASLSVGALIASRRGRPDEARARADAAVEADPSLAAAHIAQSYARQASGDIDGALDAAERGAGLGAGDALAQARVAELRLIRGDRRGARAAAEASLAIEPTPLGHIVLGFANLAEARIYPAQNRFEQAIRLDNAHPLARLGLGLTMIRDGAFEAGRENLELATALDPRRADLRTWLGRAYFEEGLGDKALSQLELAKERDPDDPNAWLFSALQLFAENRPVEAETELTEARRLGGARAVVRSERGLGEDRAVNAAALGRIYEVLGFEEQAVQAGLAAVEADHTNPAAQRLLADVADSRERTDSAVASANLTAEIYEGPSLAPIRTRNAVADLGLLETPGPASATFAEFSPFFEQDGWRLDTTVGAGTQETFFDETSITALLDGFSVGIGQFHYQTDGFRTNNDVEHDIATLQLGAQVTPWLSLFGEYQYRNSDQGDRTLEFELGGDDFADSFRITDERNLVRAGFHAQLGPDHDLAGVATYVRQDFAVEIDLSNEFFTFFQRNPNDGETAELQLQHAGRFGPVSVVSGGSWSTESNRFVSITDFGDFGLIALPPDKSEDEHLNLYTYATWGLDDLGPFDRIDLTGGVSFDDYDRADGARVNPKAGIRARLGDRLTLRASYTEAIKPSSLLIQRLEPVSVAGFVQWTNELPGDLVRQAGVGSDFAVTDRLSVGAEANWRWIETPFADATVDTEEQIYRGWANATFGSRWSGALDLTHETSTSDVGETVDFDSFDLTEARATATYHHPRGPFASLSGSYVWTSFDEGGGIGTEGSDSFLYVDATAGYRLPKQRGVLSISVQNLLDQNLNFRDRPPLAEFSDPGEPRFARELSIIAGATLRF